MTEASAPARPGTAQPYADVLLNVGKPTLSAVSDLPELDPESGSETQDRSGIDASQDAQDTSTTSDDKSGVEADGKPPKEPAVAEKDEPTPQQRAAFQREKSRRQAAERDAAALKTQVAQLAEAVAKLTGEKEQPKEDPRPKRDSFDNPDAYEQALEGWVERRATEKAKAETQAEFTKQQQESRAKTLIDSYREREASFEAEHPDYQEVVYSDDVKISPVMSQAILEAEDGPAIAYHLGQNPDVAERIAGLSPAQQVIELGRLSVKLATPPPKPKPEPIRPLNTRNAAGPKSPSEMSMEEYAEYRKTKST